MKQLEERQTNVEGELAEMKKNRVTMSRVDRKIEEFMQKMAEAQVIFT